MTGEADKQQLIKLLKPILKLSKQLKGRIPIMDSIAAVVEYWLNMLVNEPRWWKDE